ncbi:MAG: carboxypeptidase M32 [Rhizobiales bacterium]|nr:carboxypeptidase M32 [Hyphomicrobiales bacterium]
MSKFNELSKHFIKISRFNHLASICGWDQAAMMPSGGNDARGAALAELALHVHDLQNKPELAEWYEAADLEDLTKEQRATLSEMKRSWENDKIIPSDLVEAKSLASSKCEHAWRTQRGKNDWAGFAVNFEEIVKLSQEEAQIRAERAGTSRYDAMLNLYEPGVTTENLNAIFADVKTWLPNMVTEIIEKQKSETVMGFGNDFLIEKQKLLGLDTMKLLGFDFNHGRLDVSVHPFCGGVPTDVRITTRYEENEFISSMMGVVHETGHACYEQGLPKHLAGLPSGTARSMGIHESQSLFFEMQLGRSKEFLGLISPLLNNLFEEQNAGAFGADNLFKAYTRVEAGYIRVDADEATYPAHVILRYEIERDLVNGVIGFKDVPEIWDAKMQEYLGLSTKDNFKDGCMQDIHWTWGAFGYFPSYTLGAMYAAQFKAAMLRTVDVNKAINSNDLSPIFNWLSQNIWQKASLFSTDELVAQATGETLNASYFKQHLQNRYL